MGFDGNREIAAAAIAAAKAASEILGTKFEPTTPEEEEEESENTSGPKHGATSDGGPVPLGAPGLKGDFFEDEFDHRKDATGAFAQSDVGTIPTASSTGYPMEIEGARIDSTGIRSQADVVIDIKQVLNCIDNLFYLNDTLVEVKDTGRVRPVGRDRFVGLLDLYVTIVTKDKKGKSVKKERPSHEDRASLMGQAEEWAKPLVTVVKCPFIDKNGTIFTKDGYDATTNTWLTWKGGYITLPDYDDAKTLILDLLRSWKLDSAGLTAAIGLLLLTVTRNMIDGPTPIHAISAADASAGKSYLAEVVGVLAGDETQRGLDGWGSEASRELKAYLRQNPSIMFVDNVPISALTDNSDLLRTVTSPNAISFREVGGGEVIVTARPIWIFTAIDLADNLGREMARRSVAIKLLGPSIKNMTLGVLPPKERVRQDRAKYIGALLRLAKDGLKEGSQPLNEKGVPKTLDSFGHWAEVIGKILHRMGYGDAFLTSDSRVQASDDAEWVELYENWPTNEVSSPEWSSSKNIVAVCVGRGLKELAEGDTHSALIKFGSKLSKMASGSRLLSGWKLKCREGRDGKQYRPERVTLSAASPSAPTQGSDNKPPYLM